MATEGSQARQMDNRRGGSQKRRAYHEDPNPVLLPLGDQNSWYYPSHGYDSDDDQLVVGSRSGNWGKKLQKGSRWIRRNKMTAWGPDMSEWEAEERCRKRLRLMIPPEDRSPSPPLLSCLSRSPSPPLISPYPQPSPQHYSYSSFVMDKAVTHSFRSKLLDELESATNALVEGEASMKRVLGRLWQAMSEEPAHNQPMDGVVTKQEEKESDPGEINEKARRLARAPDLTPSIHKLFLLSYSPDGGPTVFEPSHFATPEMQLESLEKSLAALRELQDDGREYVERLEEIREGLGDIRSQRDSVWDEVRRRAIGELQSSAIAMVEDEP